MLDTDNSILRQGTRSVFEELYLGLRQQEQRLYSDDELKDLPTINTGHLHYREWKIRRQSSSRLISYLRQKKSPLQILEIGCGNGWLGAKLAEIDRSEVTGIDINGEDLRQAQRVFRKSNLQFREMEFDPAKFAATPFDIVVFASSIQYFSPLKTMLNKVQRCMTEGGEIHILDTHFYKASEIADAEMRSRNYYSGLGYPTMSEFYFHHQLSDLAGLSYKVMYNPTNIFNRWFVRNPFYWICLYQ